jgi:peptide deformylase
VSVLPILRWPDARLSQPCAPVEHEDLTDLIRDMFETMYAANGRGLAAPQVGVMKRLFVMDCHWKDDDPQPICMINPVIMAAERIPVVMEEGCLSIPGISVAVDRHKAVTVTWQSETGEFHMNDFDGFEARCILHELDHLNGTVTLDHLSPEDRADKIRQYEEASV